MNLIRAPKRWAAAVFAAALAGCAALAPVGKPVPPPEPRVGDTWTYAIYDGFRGYEKGRVTYRVIAVDAGSMEVEVTRDREQETRRHTRAWNPYAGLTPAGERVAYAPALPLFRFPLDDGAGWNAVSTATNARTGESFPVRVDARVRGRETVKTPAGEFDAVVIERQLIFGDENLWRTDSYVVETEWYAPAVGASVRFRHDLRYYIDKTGGGGGSEGGGGRVQMDWDRERLELTAYSRAPR
ncbi:MAG TPA: hypothetical protein VLW45_06350 [Pelomicrobium sp.]|nr:hypothetical protein [Pelomicrobium sp.]